MNFKGYTIQRSTGGKIEYLSVGDSRRVNGDHAYAGSNPWILDVWSPDRTKAIVFWRRKLANTIARKYDNKVSIVGHPAKEVMFNENYFWPWILA